MKKILLCIAASVCVVVAQAQSKQSVPELLKPLFAEIELANKSFQDARFEEAADGYGEVFRLYAQLPDSLRTRLDARNGGDFGAAVRSGIQASRAQIVCRPLFACITRANEALSAERFDEAEADCDEMLRLFRQLPDSLRKSLDAGNGGDFEASVRSNVTHIHGLRAEHILSPMLEPLDSCMCRADRSMGRKAYAEAERNYDELIRRHAALPDSVRRWSGRPPYPILR